MTDSPETKKTTVFAPRDSADIRPAATPRAVRSQRKLLILTASLVFSGILAIIWTNFLNDDNTIEISVQSVATTKTSGIEMTGARYAGTTTTGKRYVITAEKASESQTGSGEITLIAPDGNLQGENNQETKLRANQAVYFANKDQMNMRGDVVIYQSENDLTLRTEYAEADIGQGRFDAPQNVVLVSPTLHLTSQSMSARDSGNYFLFTGQTKLIVKPSPSDKP